MDIALEVEVGIAFEVEVGIAFEVEVGIAFEVSLGIEVVDLDTVAVQDTAALEVDRDIAPTEDIAEGIAAYCLFNLLFLK